MTANKNSSCAGQSEMTQESYCATSVLVDQLNAEVEKIDWRVVSCLAVNREQAQVNYRKGLVPSRVILAACATGLALSVIFWTAKPSIDTAGLQDTTTPVEKLSAMLLGKWSLLSVAGGIETQR